jgi:aminoglycoside phosphotransferase (APT) family kinase protein
MRAVPVPRIVSPEGQHEDGRPWYIVRRWQKGIPREVLRTTNERNAFCYAASLVEEGHRVEVRGPAEP